MVTHRIPTYQARGNCKPSALSPCQSPLGSRRRSTGAGRETLRSRAPAPRLKESQERAQALTRRSGPGKQHWPPPPPPPQAAPCPRHRPGPHAALPPPPSPRSPWAESCRTLLTNCSRADAILAAGQAGRGRRRRRRSGEGRGGRRGPGAASGGQGAGSGKETAAAGAAAAAASQSAAAAAAARPPPPRVTSGASLPPARSEVTMATARPEVAARGERTAEAVTQQGRERG